MKIFGIFESSFLTFVKKGFTLVKMKVHSKISKYLLVVSIEIFKTFEISKTFINSQIFEDNNFIKLLKALTFSILRKETISFSI
jgi:hypothetical protein